MSTVTSGGAPIDPQTVVRGPRGGAHAMRRPRPGVAMAAHQLLWGRAALAFLLALVVCVSLAFLAGHVVGG